MDELIQLAALLVVLCTPHDPAQSNGFATACMPSTPSMPAMPTVRAMTSVSATPSARATQSARAMPSIRTMPSIRAMPSMRAMLSVRAVHSISAVPSVRQADSWTGEDKFRHAAASWAAMVFTYAAARAVHDDSDTAFAVALPVTAAAGIGKEIVDRRRGGPFSFRDLAADALGAGAAWLFLREVR